MAVVVGGCRGAVHHDYQESVGRVGVDFQRKAEEEWVSE
jgi:hypothetical protein